MVTDRKIHIQSRAPTRIDLAGGTVDIWPIYLFLEHPSTLNLGIDLFAEAQIEDTQSTTAGSIILRSQDQNLELSLRWDQLSQASAPPALELHLKLLKHFAEERTKLGHDLSSHNVSLSTHARSPAGAGLGGSSTLSIAMIGALGTWAGVGSGSNGKVEPLKDGDRFIEITRDVETTVIHVPAGLQDYYGAMFGGLQSLHWLPGRHKRQWLPEEILSGVEDRLILFYSGQSRNSGINNWALFKGFIDHDKDVRERFAIIAASSQLLEEALLKKDWKSAGEAIREEWKVRKTLAQGISTPAIDAAFDVAYQHGASAGKICGAGGGGCFFVYVPSGNPKEKSTIRSKVESMGISSLPFHAVSRGLEVLVSRA
jgi:D-glycero-alpha-D-manno-heptose-7-phosphate kinase